MSIDHCLANAVAGKEISQDDADQLKRRYEAFRESRETGGTASAADQARLDLAEILRAEAKEKRRRAKLALRSINQTDADLKSYRKNGRADIGAAMLDKLENFGAGFSSVEGRRKAVLGMAHAQMETLLHHFRRGAFGGDRTRWNKADLTNVLKEAFGVDTGDAAAKGLAKAWTETAEQLRRRYNAAGGSIGKLENWGMPQHHDPRALRKATLPVWKEFIAPLLDVGRMKHPLTGKPVTAKELDAVLDDVWLSIATEGWDDRAPKRQASGRGALAGQRAEHRFLVFKSADDWLSYQKAFGGGGDVFAAMMGHVNAMAKDIAAMEILGPNPTGTIEWMKQAVRKEAQLAAAGKPARLGGRDGAKALDYANRIEHELDGVWGSIRGALETPVSSAAANALAATRNLITASVLGSAAISSISDVGTSIIARRFAGLPAGHAISDIVRSFGQMNRREAVRAGLILDNAMHVFHAQARYVGTLGGPQWAQYLADRVLTWSALTPWTQAARHAFGLAFQSEAAARVKLDFDQLPDALRNTFLRHGLAAGDWEKMRQVPLHEGQMLRPAEIAERVDPRLAERYVEMILSETEFAVPSGSHRARVALLDENRPGTLVGEVLRSFAQFKSFGTVFMLLHGGRVHNMIASGQHAAGAAYAGSLLLSTTIFGAAAYQMKQIAAGRDPLDVTEPAFWGAAMLQGGGLGIYGDFLFSNVNRYGNGFASTLAGPTIDRFNDFWNLTAGNAIQLGSGEKTHFGRELVKFARGNVPGGNIWYLRLAFEREVLDQIQYLADPEANKAFKRQQQFFQRNYGQSYFWAPGTDSTVRRIFTGKGHPGPQRAPDIAR